MIEAISSVKNATTRVTEAPEPDPKPVPARDPIVPEAGKVQAAAAIPEEVAPAAASFDVKLDTRTLRMYSEMRDPATDRVLYTIPTDYKAKDTTRVASPSYEKIA